jgi:hypothetical protein
MQDLRGPVGSRHHSFVGRAFEQHACDPNPVELWPERLIQIVLRPLNNVPCKSRAVISCPVWRPFGSHKTSDNEVWSDRNLYECEHPAARSGRSITITSAILNEHPCQL